MPLEELCDVICANLHVKGRPVGLEDPRKTVQQSRPVMGWKFNAWQVFPLSLVCREPSIFSQSQYKLLVRPRSRVETSPSEWEEDQSLARAAWLQDYSDDGSADEL